MTPIETERLRIRSWRAADIEGAQAIFCDPEVMRYIPAGTFAPEAVPRVLERMIEREARDGFGIWAVEEKKDGWIVGECGITYVPDGSAVEIGWLFARESWGKGFATEAARAVRDAALGSYGLAQICALILPENRASIAVANRLSMRYDRVVRAYKRDMLRYTSEVRG